MSIDIEKIRSETAGVDNTIHLLASGSALMPKPVVDAVINYTLLEARIGGYEAQALESEKLAAVYDIMASLVGAKRKEIALMENATTAWCHAFYSMPLKKGDRILTCEAEYAANYVAFLQRVKHDGITIDVIPNDDSGAIDINALEAMMDERVALIAITWIPTNGGLVNPAAAVGQVAKRHGVTYLLDACQAVGQMPVNVKELKCDFLSATGRKFLRGPRGTGFLYVAEHLIEGIEPVIIDHFAAPWVAKDQYKLRNDARRFENWENSYALRAGLAAAAEYAMAIGLKEIQQRAWSLAQYTRAALEEIPGTTIRDLGSEQCAIVSFTIEGFNPNDTVNQLRSKNIMIGASAPASTRLDAETRDLPVVMRVVPHYYNTTNEIDQFISAIKQL